MAVRPCVRTKRFFLMKDTLVRAASAASSVDLLNATKGGTTVDSAVLSYLYWSTSRPFYFFAPHYYRRDRAWPPAGVSPPLRSMQFSCTHACMPAPHALARQFACVRSLIVWLWRGAPARLQPSISRGRVPSRFGSWCTVPWKLKPSNLRNPVGSIRRLLAPCLPTPGFPRLVLRCVDFSLIFRRELAWQA